MQLNKFTDYALRILITIAQTRQAPYTIAELADCLYVPANHLVKIVHFMAKKELFEKPLPRFLLRWGFLTFPVNRKHADMASLKQAMSLLDKGEVFGIFPEGRRSVTGELDTFEKGAAFLALRCNAPVIPLYADPKAPRKLRVRMIVGEPMDVKAIAAAYSGKAVDAVSDALRDRMLELKNEMETWDRPGFLR